MRSTRMSLLALALAGTLAVTATAQDPDPPPGGYTGDKLGEALKKLGYDAQPQPGSPDAYYISFAAGNTTLYTRVSLSPDRTYIWLRTVLVQPLEPAALTNQDAIRRLLEENETIGPTRYSYSETEKNLRLSRHLTNSDMTSVKLRKAIEDFNGLVVKQEPNWRKENFVRIGGVPAEVVQKEMERLKGDWKYVETWNFDVRVPDADLKKADATARFEGSKFVVVGSGKTDSITFVIDPRGTLGRIDMISNDGRVLVGVYKLDNETLTVYMAGSYGADRPTDPAMKPGKTAIKFVLKRAPKG